MAIKPKFYKQTDSRWASYSWRGVTIGGSGCGPTAIANVVAALKKPVNPRDVFKWICSKGYMTYSDGTYWSGITAALKHYGISKFSVTADSAKAKKALKKGHWMIAVVARSRWTSGGHYIVVYGITSKDKILVSDSASSSDYRQKDGPWSEFKSAERQMWIDINPDDYIKDKPSDKQDKPKSDDKVKTYTLYVSDSYANVRKGRGTEYGAVGKLKRGTKLTLYSFKSGWYRIYKGEYKGKYIAETTLSKYEPISQIYKVVTPDGLNVRAGYSTSSDIIRTIGQGSKFKATKKRGDWVYSPALGGWLKTKSDTETYLKKV